MHLSRSGKINLNEISLDSLSPTENSLPHANIVARHHPRINYFAALLCAFIIAGLAGQARSAPESFADLAEAVSPSVVNITTSTSVASRTGPQLDVPEGSPFEDFFREFEENRPDRPQRRNSALGSGFVISEDGFIVTNNHVIDGADEIMIEFFEGFELPAEVIGTDANTDLAVLKVSSDTPLKFVSWGDSDTMRVGDWVMAMGNPLGQGFSVSAGIVSARGRALSGSYDDYIQTDAAINRGNSGGPLFNMGGQVIGVNTAILSPTGGSIGIGFAMSSRVAEGVIKQLIEFGETRRGWLGVRIQDVDEDIAESIGLEDVAGALVTDVPEGPAKEAGILSGDVILSFDGHDVPDTRTLVQIVGSSEVGAAVRVVVFRDGGTETIVVTLGRRETAEGSTAPEESEPEEPQEIAVLGMTLVLITEGVKNSMGLADDAAGLIVTAVEADSEAEVKGLVEGDIIAEAGQQPLVALTDLTERIDEAKAAGRKSLLLLVRRGGDPRFVALSLAD